jgi:hypothetical protein
MIAGSGSSSRSAPGRRGSIPAASPGWWRRRDPNALSRTRRVVRRELIRRLADAMLQAGL